MASGLRVLAESSLVQGECVEFHAALVAVWESATSRDLDVGSSFWIVRVADAGADPRSRTGVESPRPANL